MFMTTNDNERCVMARQCGACKLVRKLVRKEGKQEFDAAFGIDAFSGAEECGDTMTINTNPTQWRRTQWQR